MHLPSTVDQPLNLRLRGDLAWSEIHGASCSHWTVKDPVALAHHHFTSEEYFLLQHMRQPTSLGQLRREFQQQFAPQQITHEAIWTFLNRCHEAGLVTSGATGQGHQLLDLARRDTWRGWSLAWTQLLAIRFPGINPDRMLTAAHREFGWLISKWMLMIVSLVVIFAATLIIGNWTQFVARIPDLTALADMRNIGWLMLALAIVKILHELGHAIACKHFGGEVSELGLMLLAFTPCLYCDVSDAWQIANRWKRITISAAGIFVELGLASLAIIVWWYSQPGIVNLLALNIVMVCTVSTLLINGNPLLRYDGYYILSDLLDTPNLWQRSRKVLSDACAGWLLGLKPTKDAVTPDRHVWWLATYAMASKTYLALVLVGIVWMLIQVLTPLRLQNVAYGIAVVALAGTFVTPVRNGAQLLRNPLRRREIRSGRLTVLLGVMLIAVAALLRVPVPYRVSAPLIFMPLGAERVYATVEGTLIDGKLVGQRIEQGDVIARLKNTEIAQELLELEGSQRLQRMRLQHLQTMRGEDESVAAEIPAAEAMLEAIKTQLKDRRKDERRLVITAPIGGTILPAPKIDPSEDVDGLLEYWSGSPLDVENRLSTIRPGTLVCWIGNPNQLEAIVLVEDSEAPRVAAGQRVRLEPDALPSEVLEGEVIEVARRDVKTTHQSGAADGPLQRLSAGLMPPGREATRYHVRVRLQESDAALVVGSRGTARISTASMLMGQRLLRWVAQTFRI